MKQCPTCLKIYDNSWEICLHDTTRLVEHTDNLESKIKDEREILIKKMGEALTKQCPICKEIIMKDALICPHCKNQPSMLVYFIDHIGTLAGCLGVLALLVWFILKFGM